MADRRLPRNRHSKCLALVCLALVAFAGCGSSAQSVVDVRVSPRTSLADRPLIIRVTGLQPDERATLDLTSTDANRATWRSSAVYRADRHGTIDLGQSAALTGSYSGINAMGLIDSLAPANQSDELYYWHRSVPQRFAIAVHIKSATITSATFTRQAAARGVTVHTESLANTGFVGQFWQPSPGARPHPAVLEFGGSEGGLDEQLKGELLASHGYPTLDLAYFKEPGLPSSVAPIPLEYFAKALTWLSRQPQVNPHRIYTDGYSLGSQAALLLGVYYPQLVYGVIASSPSNVAQCSYPACFGPAWTFHGQPIPYTAARDQPYPTDNPAAVIPVERIHGPIFLACGGADQVWTSCAFARAIVARLNAHHDSYLHLMYAYPSAGHAIGSLVPYSPVSPAYQSQNSTLNGTTPLANDTARALVWPRLLAFLARPAR